MDTLSFLDGQLQKLAALWKRSAKSLDTFAETSAAIENRTRRIRQDVQPWETAQENITVTIEEMAKATRSYRFPPFVPAVLAKKDTDPLTICKAIDYLVYAHEYLSNKPSNDVGDAMQERVTKQMEQILTLAKERIISAFVQATTKFGGGSGAGPLDFKTPARSTTLLLAGAQRSGSAGVGQRLRGGGKATLDVSSLPHIVRNRDALKGIDSLVRKVYDTFNDMDAVSTDVKRLLEEKLTQSVQSLFDASYFEENEGVRDPSATHINLAVVTRHYQRGDHRLLKISEACRKVVREIADILHTYVLTPLSDDYDVVELPQKFAHRVFDIVLARAKASITMDLRNNGDATHMFLASRGAGIGLCPAGTNNGRLFRDCLFIGLDLVPELWKWKDLAAGLPGDIDSFVEHVDDSLLDYVDLVRSPLDTYADAKGTIDATQLLKLTLETNMQEWAPPFDGTAHESSTNVLYLLKVIFSDYFGAAKLVLHYGRMDGPEDDLAAMEELKEFARQCVLGTVEDLHTIARTMVELEEHSSVRKKVVLMARSAIKQAGKLAKVSSTTPGGQQLRSRLNEDVFVVNNVSYLLEHFRREECFLKRTETVPWADEGGANGGGSLPNRRSSKTNSAAATATNTPTPSEPASRMGSDDDENDDEGEDDVVERERGRSRRQATSPKTKEVPIVTDIMSELEQLREDAVRSYIYAWDELFPDVNDDEHLREAVDHAHDEDSPPLSPEQRMAVKHWYGNVAKALRTRIDQGCVHVVLDSRVRTELIEGSIEIVRRRLEEMDDLFEHKEWSKRPMKWRLFSTEEWVREIEKMF